MSVHYLLTGMSEGWVVRLFPLLKHVSGFSGNDLVVENGYKYTVNC